MKKQLQGGIKLNSLSILAFKMQKVASQNSAIQLDTPRPTQKILRVVAYG